MALIYLYRNDENRFEIYDLNEDDQMPYVIMNSMSVAEFRGSSQSNVLWTTLDCIKAWNRTRTEFGPIPFRYAFKRIWEGGHGDQSQHYAGV
ncbi:MAG: peptidoglycan-binding protein, partial [Longicatena sp.]|nr:peptidoglycan-binding protein [Longicatena sp.]